ncbi:hypothetical protein [Gracilibacillus timonensis]|nr:hypothetical protein [Gracilibacillus timonensis]
MTTEQLIEYLKALAELRKAGFHVTLEATEAMKQLDKLTKQS